jgi:hypothetical protein
VGVSWTVRWLVTTAEEGTKLANLGRGGRVVAVELAEFAEHELRRLAVRTSSISRVGIRRRSRTTR